MTRKQEENNAYSHYPMYLRSSDTSLYDVYGRFSVAKAKAWEYCKTLCEEHNGWGLKIISHNYNVFTAGFEFCDAETGVLCFMYITPTYDVWVEVTE